MQPISTKFLGSLDPRILLAPLVLAALSGCGEGDGVSISSGGSNDADPVNVEIPIAYVRRPVVLDDLGLLTIPPVDQMQVFEPGGDLHVRSNASPTAVDTNITRDITGGLGDVRDLDVSFDGRKVVFSLRLPLLEDTEEEDQPTWNIWEFSWDTGELRRVIPLDDVAELGNDRFPSYLPDGRIVFSSTRQTQAAEVLVNEGKQQYQHFEESGMEFASVLHVMNADGSDVHQISFNLSHDFEPSVLSTGQIVFARWDQVGLHDELNLYRSNPDGSDLQLLYGVHSHLTGSGETPVQFVQPRETEDGELIALLMPFDGTEGGGEIVTIDVQTYIENDQEAGGDPLAIGTAQVDITDNDVSTEPGPSRGGRFRSVFPLWDGTDRFLVSWSQCRLVDEDNLNVPCTDEGLAEPDFVLAQPLYGLWIYDRSDQTQQPVVPPVEGWTFTEVVAGEVRDRPPVIYDIIISEGFDPDMVEDNMGMINIRSVYDVAGNDFSPTGIEQLANGAVTTAAAERPYRFLRLVRPVSVADSDVVDVPGFAFGGSPDDRMWEILGYSLIEPDGSVMVKVPADVPFAMHLLDGEGERVLSTPLHNNWLQVRPGQVLECNGCHLPDAGFSHGREDAFPSAYAGAATTALPFPGSSVDYIPELGETMAEARARVSCETDCAAVELSPDVAYTDHWTDEGFRPKDIDFSMLYAQLETPPPITDPCAVEWESGCRVIINYEEHIHPLWYLSRPGLDGDNLPTDFMCAGCHLPEDMDGNLAEPPASLDLTDGPHAVQTNFMNAYVELLFNDFEQEPNGAALQDVEIDTGQVDEDGLPILVRVQVIRSMSPTGANFSGRFFTKFRDDGSHVGYLSDAEMRLIGEWLDIGAQYYNNPFDIPGN